MKPGDPPSHRVHKRKPLSDQQKRRDVALQRQQETRRNLQNHARQLASAVLANAPNEDHDGDDNIGDVSMASSEDPLLFMEEEHNSREQDIGLMESTRLKGAKAREWFSKQLSLPEWMIDMPSRLRRDWYVIARPAGKRCIVVSSHGTTISRLRNGRIFHQFPSALPNGARTRGVAAPSHVFCILDCIFHEPNQTYYVIDMMCWRGYSLYDCNYEFRYFWMNSKLADFGVFNPPSTYHRYAFSLAPLHECDVSGLQMAYSGQVPFVRDGILLYNRHSHYVLGHTPLVLLWKDPYCCQYYLDTDSKGNVPQYQQVVLKLQADGSLVTDDDLPAVLGSLSQEILQANTELKEGMLVRIAISEGLSIVDGKPVVPNIQFQGIGNRSRAGADSVSKILFQYAARHAPLTISDLVAAVNSVDGEGDEAMSSQTDMEGMQSEEFQM